MCLLESCISSYIGNDSFTDEKNQSVVTALKDWLLGGLSNEKVIRDSGTSKCYTLREAANVVNDPKFTQRMKFAPCGLYDAYISAVRSTTDRPHETISSSKRRKLMSYEVASKSIDCTSSTEELKPATVVEEPSLSPGDYVGTFDAPSGSLATKAVHTPFRLQAGT